MRPAPDNGYVFEVQFPCLQRTVDDELEELQQLYEAETLKYQNLKKEPDKTMRASVSLEALLDIFMPHAGTALTGTGVTIDDRNAMIDPMIVIVQGRGGHQNV